MASLAPAEKAPAGKPLKVGSPHDPAEREADRIADILTAPEEPAMPVCAACAAGGAPCPACGGDGVLRGRAARPRGFGVGLTARVVHATIGNEDSLSGSALPDRANVQAPFGKNGISGGRALGGEEATRTTITSQRHPTDAYAPSGSSEEPPLEVRSPKHSDGHGVGALGRALGYDFRNVEVRVGNARGSGRGAFANVRGGREIIAFDESSPSREQVAHELIHVAQSRRFGEGRGGVAARQSAPEVEARALAPRIAAGETVDVHAAPAGSIHRDDTVAQQIHEKLHGTFFDDEAGALLDLRTDTNRATTVSTYQSRYNISLWDDFIANASGPILHQALALLQPHTPLLQRLESYLGWDDDEGSILQAMQNASDAELQEAGRDRLLRYVDELDAPDGYTALRRISPNMGVANVLWLLQAGDGWLWDDEGPVASAIMNLRPSERLELWTRHQSAFAMFNEHDKAQIGRMCQRSDGTAATDADAVGVRMELATDGLGTDEDGVLAAVAAAGSRRDELARIDETLRSGRGPSGRPLTESQRQALERRRTEIGDIDGLLTPTYTTGGLLPGTRGSLNEDSFLGRVQGDMDAGTLDAAMTTAHVDALHRAKQQLLMTLGDLRIDVDEDRALEIMRTIQGDVALRPGETIDSLSPAEIRRRRDQDAQRIRFELRRDPDLEPVWAALDRDETTYLDAMVRGDALTMAVAELTRAFECLDTDEARILRILRDLDPAVRRQLHGHPPPIIARIRGYVFNNDAFLRAFEAVLETGVIPATDALDAASGGWGDGTDEDMITDVLRSLTTEQRTQYRRGYMLAHRGAPGMARVCAPGVSLGPEDQAALDAYNALYTRLNSELETEELDSALTTLLGLPSVAEMQTDAGRFDAATIMLLRQRERLRMGAALLDPLITADDTAASAHVEYESHYTLAVEGNGVIDENEFAVLVNLDSQFNQRFGEYQNTANMVSEIAGTVAAVVAAAVVIIASGGTATAATPGVVAWLSANSSLIATSAAVSALSQVVAAEAMGGDFHEATGADGARGALSGALNGAMAVCGAALAERAAELVGLSGRALTAQIASSAAGATEQSVGGRAFVRGALTGLIDGSLGGAVGELAMTLTDAETWRRSVWDVLARAGASLIRGGLLGGFTGAAAGGLMESATRLLQARSLRGVAVRMDEALEVGAHIDFDIAESGAIDNLTLRFGPRTTDGDLAAHVESIVAIQRASRVLSQARELATVSGHAQAEVAKIEPMILDRLRQLRTALSPETRQVIQAELDMLQANLDEFARVARSGDASLGSGHIGRPDAPPGYPAPPEHHYYRRRGDGWDLQLYPDSPEGAPRFTLEADGNGGWRIAGRADASAPSPRFPDGTTPARAFDQLTGPESRSSFKQYWEMLRDNGLATREEVIAAMLAPRGRSEDSVRHALKEAFEGRVLERCMRTADGVARSEAESMLELRRLTQHLNSSDRGNLTEAWYLARHEGLSPHPTMTRDANPGVEGRGGRGVRKPDFVEGETLVELKSTRIGLGAEEVTQINDDLLVSAARGTVTLKDGTVRHVSSVRLVFSNIEGARGAGDQLAVWIARHANFTIEVFGRNLVSTRINQGNLGALQRANGVDTLHALLGVL